jgi:pyruvyl transferase EpsO
MTLDAPEAQKAGTSFAEGRDDVGRRMQHLSASLNEHAALVEGNAVLLDYPVHGNVGDLLIWKGEQAFLKRNKKRLIGQYSIRNMGRGAAHDIAKCDTICLHGGGNFGDLWPVHQKFREDIIKKCPSKRIIVFPQSVFYADINALDRACAVLTRHPDLHILLRDRVSLQLLKERGLPNLRLCPDMAHALWGRWPPASPVDEQNWLYLLRRDKERGDLPPSFAGMEVSSNDWADLRQGRIEKWFRYGTKVINMNNRYGNALPACSAWNLVADALIERAMELLAAHGKIVTNRLHAVISAALIGRPVVAYDNSYGKVSAYVTCWLSDLGSIDLK